MTALAEQPLARFALAVKEYEFCSNCANVGLT
jgi:hypothetical protein